MIFAEITEWRRHLHGPAWERAFAFLSDLNSDTPEGDTALDGEAVFGRVMVYKTRVPEEGLLETHRRYVDLQVTLDGAEGIEWFPRRGLDIREPYDVTLDREVYQRPGTPPARMDVYPGTFCVFFPEDAHLAQQIVGSSPRTIRKAVVKIALEALA